MYSWPHIKLNVDASIRSGSATFSIGLVLRDHLGNFAAGKVISFSGTSMVLEAEAIAICEGFKWMLTLTYHKVSVESDSLISRI